MSAAIPDKADHAIESWFVSSQSGYFVCRCQEVVDVAGYVDDSIEAAFKRHVDMQNVRRTDV